MLKRNRWDQQPSPSQKQLYYKMAASPTLFNQLTTTTAVIGQPSIYPTVGTTQSQHQGRGIIVRDLLITYSIICQPTTTGTDIVRLIIYNDNQYKGSASTAAQLMDTDSTNGNISTLNAHQFEILHQSIHGVTVGSSTASIGKTIVIPINRKVHYKDNDQPIGFQIMYAGWIGANFATAAPRMSVNCTMTYNVIE